MDAWTSSYMYQMLEINPMAPLAITTPMSATCHQSSTKWSAETALKSSIFTNFFGSVIFQILMNSWTRYADDKLKVKTAEKRSTSANQKKLFSSSVEVCIRRALVTIVVLLLVETVGKEYE